MPLTAKGKKLKEKFKEQYGKKKGESVFYAMENSGKLQKVIKRKGGGADMGDPGRAEERASRGYGSTAGVDRSAVGAGSQYAKNVTAQKNTPIQKIKTNIQKLKTPTQKAGLFTAKTAFTMPISPTGLFVTGVKAFEKGRRKKRAKGEFLFSQKKVDHITREFYRTEGRPLDYTIGGKDEGYFKAAGITGGPKGLFDKKDGPTQILCPDGSLPPCAKPKTSAPSLPKPTNNFLADFRAYNSGGVSKGPPPKRGPNPQVPPVKMKEGKMSKKYKMSCPHRPDGIRGVGAAIRGHKFIGVK